MEDGETGWRGGGPPGEKRDRGSELPLRTACRRPIGGGARVGGTTQGRTAINGGTPPVSRPMVTIMVQERKLIGGVMLHFPHPSCHFGGKRVLQTSRLSERVSVFGRFWGYQIVPNFTNFYQKCVAKRVRRGSKRQLTGGFWRPIYLNRVKSSGSCQAVTETGFRDSGFGIRREPTLVRHFSSANPELRTPNPISRSPGFYGPRTVQQSLARLPLSREWCRAIFRGLSGAAESLRGQSVDSTMVVRQVAQPKKLQRGVLKNLLATVPASVGAPFSLLSDDSNVARQMC